MLCPAVQAVREPHLKLQPQAWDRHLEAMERQENIPLLWDVEPGVGGKLCLWSH